MSAYYPFDKITNLATVKLVKCEDGYSLFSDKAKLF